MKQTMNGLTFFNKKKFVVASYGQNDVKMR